MADKKGIQIQILADTPNEFLLEYKGKGRVYRQVPSDSLCSPDFTITSLVVFATHTLPVDYAPNMLRNDQFSTAS